LPKIGRFGAFDYQMNLLNCNKCATVEKFHSCRSHFYNFISVLRNLIGEIFLK